MLIPRFTVRWLLALTTVVAVFFYIVSLATQGSVWAQALVIAVSSLAGLVLLHALAFSFAYLLAWMVRLSRRPQLPVSPFATDRTPEQILPPVDPP